MIDWLIDRLTAQVPSVGPAAVGEAPAAAAVAVPRAAPRVRRGRDERRQLAQPVVREATRACMPLMTSPASFITRASRSIYQFAPFPFLSFLCDAFHGRPLSASCS